MPPLDTLSSTMPTPSPESNSSFNVEQAPRHQQTLPEDDEHNDDDERQSLVFNNSSQPQEQTQPQQHQIEIEEEDLPPNESSSSSSTQRLLCRSRSLPAWTAAGGTQRLLMRNHTSNTHKLLQSSAASNDLGFASTTTGEHRNSQSSDSTETPRWILLLWCFGGLQVSYLTWAFLQELLMTTRFTPTPLNPSGLFPSAVFCVFLNRTVALTTATMVLQIRQWRKTTTNHKKKQPQKKKEHNPQSTTGSIASATPTTTSTTATPVPPLSLFCPCAISNALSSVAQYSSLHFVSFPVMTVFKSSTILPVMLLGYCIKGTTYSSTRIIQALVITIGVVVFSLGSSSLYDEEDDEKETTTTTTTTPDDIPTTSAWGMALLLSYVLLDSFTTTWQDVIYSHHPTLDSFQMMKGVDTVALAFTSVSLLASGQLPAVWEFYHANPHVILYSLACPIMSTTGQLFIFQTIKEFGPVVFTVIMTTRKLFSIGISSVLFGHLIEPPAAWGGLLVLLAIGHTLVTRSRNRGKK